MTDLELGRRFPRRETAQETALLALRELLLAGALGPGQQITQDEVAEAIGVSRVPVREALRILESEGQVRYRPQRGYFVTELHLGEVREIYRIRKLLETEALRNALPKLDNEVCERLRDAMRAIESCDADNSVAEMTRANRRFHFVLFEAAGMPHLLNHIRLLWEATDPYRSLYYMRLDHRDRVHEEHRRLYEAAVEGDLGVAISISDRHRSNAISAMAEVLDRRA